MLTGFDYAVLLIIVLSALRGMWRGLMAEVFALIGWIAAFIIGWHYVDRVAPYMPAHWPGEESTQWLLALVLIVVTVLILSTVLNALVSRVTEIRGLRGIDRSLGLLFGFARGVLLVLLVFMAAQFTRLPQQAFWRDALLRPYVQTGVDKLKKAWPKRNALNKRLKIAASI
jgi:membrane protein required for colicin V production